MSVKIFAQDGSWIESDSVDQCHQVAGLPGMIHVAGMPDLHPGKGAPIGAAMLGTVLYPLLVGSDIGCGIAVYPVKFKGSIERIASKMPDLDIGLDPGELDEHLAELGGTLPGGHVNGMGTLGRGNHFVELARVEDVKHSGHASRLGVIEGAAVLIVHSGSRGLGEQILRAHTEIHGAGPAPDPSAYLRAHDQAVAWGHINRAILARRVASGTGMVLGDAIVDECHNQVTVSGDWYLHRKGATNGDGTDVLVAGSRGTRSYLMHGTSGPDANHSIAHGAGRKMSRGDAYARNKVKHRVEDLKKTPLGSIVVCGDRQLLFEEAPASYKNITAVIADIEHHKLGETIAATVPLITYKTPESSQARPASNHRDKGRRQRR